MTYGDGVSNGLQRCCECEAVRSAILATAWLLVLTTFILYYSIRRLTSASNSVVFRVGLLHVVHTAH